MLIRGTFLSSEKPFFNTCISSRIYFYIWARSYDYWPTILLSWLPLMSNELTLPSLRISFRFSRSRDSLEFSCFCVRIIINGRIKIWGNIIFVKMIILLIRTKYLKVKEEHKPRKETYKRVH